MLYLLNSSDQTIQIRLVTCRILNYYPTEDDVSLFKNSINICGNVGSQLMSCVLHNFPHFPTQYLSYTFTNFIGHYMKIGAMNA